MTAAISEEDYAFKSLGVRDFVKGKPLYLNKFMLKCIKHEIDGVFGIGLRQKIGFVTFNGFLADEKKI
jgi:hypothetical protein